ncbi:MAG: hypothetical protein DME86_02395 [Verrucomicrobia bacterium]|nr:MAG: hypothetical protein DME86_02395 [Verrucomicrobiota bacterium]
MSAGNSSDHVEQENEQIVRMPKSGRQQLFVHDFEIDQTRAIRLFVINHVRHRCVPVRPAPAELIAPKLMRTMIFARSGLEHAFAQRSLVHVIPKILSGQFVQHHCSCIAY